MNQVNNDNLDVQLIERNLLDNGNADGDAEIDLDVVDDVTGVDTPYKEYMDEWNKDVLENGDNFINQYVGKSDAGVYEAAAADEAFEAEQAGDVEFEPISGSSDPITPAGVTTPAQDGGGRPIRVCKPVSRLFLSFKGK